MKVLIYGHDGWIGKQFFEIISKKHQCIKGKSRVDSEKDVCKELEQHKPSHVISFIGRTHGIIEGNEYTTIDYLEKEGKLVENIRDNLYSPFVLAMLCTERNIHYTYLGTGCIFEYDDNHPFGKELDGFSESSLPNFFGSSYSIVKGFTDRMMHLFKDNILNLRIRMPITNSQNKRNFITKIISYEKICSIPNSMTVLPELLPYVIDLMELKYTGTLNFTNPGLISHNEILNMYREIVNPNFTWSNFTIKEQEEILDSKRSNNFLETTKLQILFPNIKNIKDSVRDCLVKYKNCPENKNILVTGGSEFIASSFINSYFEKNSNDIIINIDAIQSDNHENIKKKVQESSRYHFFNEKLEKKKFIRQILYKYNITHVLHFTSQFHEAKENILGTHVLLEECQKYNQIQKFIHVSTDTPSINTISTDQKITKIQYLQNPFSARNISAEMISMSYFDFYKMPIIIANTNSVFGEYKYSENIIAKFITELLKNNKMTIYGDGHSAYSFLHINDVVEAFEIILEKGTIGKIYNISADKNMKYSILEIATILTGMIHPKKNVKQFVEFIENKTFKEETCHIPNDNLKSLGWNIKKEFYEGIREVIQYFQIKKLEN